MSMKNEGFTVINQDAKGHFVKGNKVRLGDKNPNAGRPPGVKTQIRRWEEENPNAYAELMDTLYARAQGRSSMECPYCHESFTDPMLGDSEAAKYVIDRIKGKPKATIGMDEEDRDLLKGATVVKLFQIMEDRRRELETQKQIIEGNGGI